MIAAIFLDRDGTIIEDTHYPRDPDLVSLTPNAAEGMRLMNKKGYFLFVVSNQSGVGRGIIKDFEFQAVHKKCCDLLKNEGVEVAQFAYCFHHPEDGCSCRKPGTDLVVRNFNNKPIDFANSFVVGDKLCDLELADNLHAQGVLVLTGKGKYTLAELQQLDRSSTYRVSDDLIAVARSLPAIT